MDFDGFYDWLISKKAMSNRSAKDVLSRCKRVCGFLSTDAIDTISAEDLNTNAVFNEQSMFIKSQLRRAVALWKEFRGN